MPKVRAEARIRIASQNPYEARFPGRRVVSRELLHIIKLCRTKGVQVVVDPEDGTKLHYTIEKGVRDVLADPIYIYIIGLPTSLIINIISSWFYEYFKRKPKSADLNVIIECDADGRRLRYSHTGREISDRRFKALMDEVTIRASRFADSQQLTPPTPSRPYPIFLEHTHKVVGWGNVRLDGWALRTEDVVFTDDDALERVDRGELKGFSIGGLVNSSKCSICALEYTDCNHLTGRKYRGKPCINEIKEVDLAEISLVREPVNKLCVITRKPPHN